MTGSSLMLASVASLFEAWTYWNQLTTWSSFLIGFASGGFLISGLLVLLWRPRHPATRYEASLPSPSPWDRNRWR